MPLINRFAKLVRADANAVLDQLEEPHTLLRQAVRDMEEELIKYAQDIQRTEGELEHLQHKSEEILTLSKRFDEEIGVCFNAGKDDLARNFVRRKLESQSMYDHLKREISITEKTLKEQRRQHDEHQSQYESMRQKSELLWQDMQLKQGQTHKNTFSDCGSILEDDVEIAFLREKQKFNEGGTHEK